MSSIKRVEREAAARRLTAEDSATLTRLARLFAANPNSAAYTGPHVTNTGRALSRGKVTRKSKAGRQRARGEISAPLPIHLSVHPKRLTPTARHPDCLTRVMRPGDVVVARYTWSRDDMLAGRGLSPKMARYEVVAVATLGYCSSPMDAVTWREAAKMHGIDCVIVERW